MDPLPECAWNDLQEGLSEVKGLAFLLSSGMGGLQEPLARVQGLAEEAASGCLLPVDLPPPHICG